MTFTFTRLKVPLTQKFKMNLEEHRIFFNFGERIFKLGQRLLNYCKEITDLLTRAGNEGFKPKYICRLVI